MFTQITLLLKKINTQVYFNDLSRFETRIEIIRAIVFFYFLRIYRFYRKMQNPA